MSIREKMTPSNSHYDATKQLSAASVHSLPTFFDHVKKLLKFSIKVLQFDPMKFYNILSLAFRKLDRFSIKVNTYSRYAGVPYIWDFLGRVFDQNAIMEIQSYNYCDAALQQQLDSTACRFWAYIL
jgi:hypothetical protein